MNVVPVILAGGIGERFWPLSRSSRPKQLLCLISRRTMAEETLSRVKAIMSGKAAPLVVTSSAIAGKLRAAIPKKWGYDTIVEPVGRNTAPAVAIAAAWVQARYGDSVMVVLSADHNIRPKNEFIRAAKFAVHLAIQQNRLVVFGIKPNRPETGYGYIQLGKQLDKQENVVGYNVVRFVEKPTVQKAKQYIRSGNYMWNSGMFVWKTSVILEEFKSYMPALYDLTQAAARKGFSNEAINRFYKECEKESIDYGIMEHSKRVSAAVGAFEWDDIGSWEYAGRVYGQSESGNTLVGKGIYEKDCRNTIVVNKSPLAVASIGLDNIVVVATDDAVMVVKRELLPDLKKYLVDMKKNGRLPKSLF
jgi:mannose-1-phosphate guanylyltransferase